MAQRMARSNVFHRAKLAHAVRALRAIRRGTGQQTIATYDQAAPALRAAGGYGGLR